MEKLLTGIKGFDKLIKGGIPSGYSVVLLGAPGTKKTLFAQHIAQDHIERGGTVLFILTKKGQTELIGELREFGWDDCQDHFDSGRIMVIDAYSWKLGDSESIPPSDVTKLSIRINKERKKLEEKGDVMEIFNTASEFSLFNKEPVSVFGFFEKACARARESNTLLLMIVEEGMHSERDLVTFESFTQGTIQLKEEADGRYVRIKKMDAIDYPLDWFPIDISEKGIEVK